MSYCHHPSEVTGYREEQSDRDPDDLRSLVTGCQDENEGGAGPDGDDD